MLSQMVMSRAISLSIIKTTLSKSTKYQNFKLENEETVDIFYSKFPRTY